MEEQAAHLLTCPTAAAFQSAAACRGRAVKAQQEVGGTGRIILGQKLDPNVHQNRLCGRLTQLQGEASGAPGIDSVTLEAGRTLRCPAAAGWWTPTAA